jgi:predicted  nucleic acid-binding Zn-ribbon protein
MSDAQTQIKTLHTEILTAQKNKKEIMAVLKDAFSTRKEYSDLVDQMSQLRARKKEIENIVRAEYSHEYNEMEDIREDIKDSKMVLSDLIWNELIKNNSVEVIDEANNHYVPNIVATLKKDKDA